MSIIDLSSLTRAAWEHAAGETPTQYPGWTPECPSLADFPDAARQGWAGDRRRHVVLCTHCRSTMALQWSNDLPGIWGIAQHVAWETLPDQETLDIMLDPGQAQHVRSLIRSQVMGMLAGLIRDGCEEESRLWAAGTVAGSDGRDGVAGSGAPFHLRLENKEARMVTTIGRSPEGELEIAVECADLKREAQWVEVEIVRAQDESLKPKLELVRAGSLLIARHSFGDFQLLAPTLEGCTVVALSRPAVATECRSLYALVRYLAGDESGAGTESIRHHLEEGGCRRCALAAASALVTTLAALLRAKRRTPEQVRAFADRVVWAYTRLPDPAPAGVKMKPEAGAERFRAAAESGEQGGLNVTLSKRAGKLQLSVDAPVAISALEVEVVGARGRLAARMDLEAIGTRSAGDRDLGPFPEEVLGLGEDCLLLAAPPLDTLSS
jgi:hypothetical protein